ncbi:ABC transporter ATP-binding protein [Paraburkholderia aspalathi]|uniref:Putative spermidine/putrescine transport system ATP-binding protein n=1 Tax=Paraburkholderia aspalathi TaxID=1324617 RepID=A0A1I7AAQ6_9BURK|nr:ABC transporter ATP-binding protein [Paraburkholderia aspalathi]SFT71920.1 putative spermidine/putrescine transport system ATP-binding protein [Paraburkholderia aspalathi]
MAFLELLALTRRYAGTVAVHELSLSVERGEFVSLLGPSGCGKTTTLQMIAGFVAPSAGTIRLAGRDLSSVKANARGLGIVFQSYALFPHMTVAENVAFGLETRRIARAERTRRVARALELVRLDALGDRYPAQLSGGQRQRVALARALVIEPPVLLLDEPLSNLDAKLRDDMQGELRRIQRTVGTTTIMVTHDQAEAMALSDRVAVMHRGRLEQAGAPLEVYEHPATAFVADFLGKTNLIDGQANLGTNGTAILIAAGQRFPMLDRPAADGPVRVSLRPEKIELIPDPTAAPVDSSAITGTVRARTYGGDHWLYDVDTLLGAIRVRCATGTAAEGHRVGLRWHAGDLRIVEKHVHG